MPLRGVLATARRLDVASPRQDRLEPSAFETLASLGRRVQVTTIDGAGHHPHVTHADEVATAVVTDTNAAAA